MSAWEPVADRTERNGSFYTVELHEVHPSYTDEELVDFARSEVPVDEHLYLEDITRAGSRAVIRFML